MRGRCSGSEPPRQSEGSNQVTSQGIRQTVGIKSFTWKLALYLQSPAFVSQPSLLFVSLLPPVLCQVCQGLVPGCAASPGRVWGALSSYWAVQRWGEPSGSRTWWEECGFGAALGLSVTLRKGSGSLQWAWDGPEIRKSHVGC